MKVIQDLIDHLNDLKKSEKEAAANGEWERVDYIGLCIDDTRDEIKAQRLIQFRQAAAEISH